MLSITHRQKDVRAESSPHQPPEEVQVVLVGLFQLGWLCGQTPMYKNKWELIDIDILFIFY